jgi:hypothetical protein
MNSREKIREIIDNSLLDSDEFTIKLENETLCIESVKQRVIHHALFIALIIVPVITLLWNDRSIYSLAVSVFYFSTFSYSYFNILKYEVDAVFKFRERILIYDNRIFKKLGKKIKTISFEGLDSVELS